MNEKNLVICGEEAAYARALAENLLSRSEFAIRVCVCSDIEAAANFRKRQEIHMLLIDESVPYAERVGLCAARTFVLTAEGCADLGDREIEIFKYQSADGIFAQVVKTYFAEKGNGLIGRIPGRGGRLYGVFSPIHRIGKTEFAIAAGEELAGIGRTLYVNLEEFPDIGGRFERAEGENLADLLYYMRQDEDKALHLSAVTRHMGDLEYIPPAPVGTDLLGILPEEWMTLLTFLLNETPYENVVLDIGEGLQGVPGILAECDRVFMPILTDFISRQKISLFDEIMRKTGYADANERFYRFEATDDMRSSAKKILRELKGEAKIT